MQSNYYYPVSDYHFPMPEYDFRMEEQSPPGTYKYLSERERHQ